MSCFDLGLTCPPPDYDYFATKRIIDSCLPPPKANSYFICWCEVTITTKRCFYHCNLGYHWNPVTLTCDIDVVPSPEIGVGSAFYMVVPFGICHNLYKRRKRKRNLIGI